jgi:hypothetical protein
MRSYIPDSKRFREESEATAKNVFRSTLLPPDERLMKACRKGKLPQIDEEQLLEQNYSARKRP